MVTITEVKKVKLSGNDRVALIRYAETFMEFSCSVTDPETIAIQTIYWEGMPEKPRLPLMNEKQK